MFDPHVPADRRIIVAAVLVGLVPAFVVTHLVVARFKDHRADLAAEWTARGQHDLPQTPNAAVADFETALSYSPDDGENRLRLAQALIADKRPAEAEAHLLTLWSEQPGSGRINLELARISAATGDLGDAVRYYHGAIDGAWESGAGTARRNARLELARLLLASGQNVRAQAELIALIDDLPADAAVVTDVGSLLLRAGAPTRAITMFQRALMLDAANRRAAELAGDVEYAAGNYDLAIRYLSRAAQTGPLDAQRESMLEISRRVRSLDPSAARLSARERSRRLDAALAVARDRLARCEQAGTTDADMAARIAELRAQSEALVKDRARKRRQNEADVQDEESALVFAIETLPAQVCGPDTVDDRALQIVGAQERTRAR